MDLKVKFVLHSLRKRIKTVKSIIKGKLLILLDGVEVSLVHETYLCAAFKKTSRQCCAFGYSGAGWSTLPYLCHWELNLSSYGTALKTIMIKLEIIMK